MSFSPSRFGAALIAGSLAIGAGQFVGANEALAQAKPKPAAPAAPAAGAPAAPQGPMRVQLTPTSPQWSKVCFKDQTGTKELCYTSREFGAQPDQPPALAVAVYDVKGEETKLVRFLMPVGLSLRPGFRFAVDDGQPSEGYYEVCFPNGCFAESKVKSPVVDAIKKGTTLHVNVKNQAADVIFDIPLAGFAPAFDGPPIDPKIIQEQQKKLAEQLQKRADEERKKLQEQQNAVSGAPTAPAAPAAPK